jgi:uncharacterized protein YkwD
LSVAILSLPGHALAQGGCGQPANAPAEVALVMNKINALRAKRGLSPLKMEATLVKAAAGRACVMTTTGEWGHGASPKARMRRAGCSAGATGEAIAKGFKGGAPTFDLWLNSPKHLQIMMMRSARYAGLAMVTDANGGNPHWVLNVSNRC